MHITYTYQILRKNYMLHSSENLFDKRFNQHYIKEVLGGALGNRTDAVKHYNKYEHQ